jgi:hypothetical protein
MVPAMAVSESSEVVIEATPDEIVGVITDTESLPEWSDAQDARYITVDPLVPLPGFLLKKAIKGVLGTATDGLRERVLSQKKGR